MDYQGFVNGIDVMQQVGTTRCFAFINQAIGSDDYIQVQTEDPQLQSALETASIKNVRVEVTYDDLAGVNNLRRVRLLDR